MLFGMDSSIISGVVVLPAFLTRFGLDGAGSKAALANLQANIVSTLQAGCFAGAIIAGFMADRIGRRMSLLVAKLSSGHWSGTLQIRGPRTTRWGWLEGRPA